jgi:hypothetical protein
MALGLNTPDRRGRADSFQNITKRNEISDKGIATGGN